MNLSTPKIVNAGSCVNERILVANKDVSLLGHLGIGLASIESVFNGSSVAPIVPVGLNLISGGGDNHFELNLGAWITSNSAFPDISVGYRYQSKKEPFVFHTSNGTTGLGLGFGVRF